MAVIPVEMLAPATGAAPSNACDPVSNMEFTQWELDDEARFSFTIPDNFLSSDNIVLRLQESSPSVSARHSWQAITVLFRPGSDVTNQQSISETSTLECLSSSTPDQLVSRSFTVTGSILKGAVGTHQISAGDLVGITLKRIPVPAGEDPNAIKLFDLSATHCIDDTRISDCAGRVGSIIDTVRDLFNESTGGFLPDEFILRSINRCLQDLAQENYWRKETWIPANSGIDEIDLTSAIPGFQDIHQVRFSGRSMPMAVLGSFKEFLEVKTGGGSRGSPVYYSVQNCSLCVWPPPLTDMASGYCIYHSYLPAALTCTQDNPDPPVPRAHDSAFVYFVLRQAFLRDRHAPGADQKYQEYAQLYEREKQKLLGEGDPPQLSLRPSR